jgi:hypothetical protein
MRIAMYDRLLTQFPTKYGSALPVGFENQKFEQPLNNPYLIAWFKYSPSKRASIGTTNRFDRHTGFFIVDCLVPEKTGAATMWQMADAVVNSFEAQNFTLGDGSAVTLMVPSTYSSGRAQDGFYLVTVMVPFMIDAVPIR